MAQEREELVLTIYDWDRFSKDDVVGCVRIKVALIHTHSLSHTHVSCAKNDVIAYVRIKVALRARERERERERERGRVRGGRERALLGTTPRLHRL